MILSLRRFKKQLENDACFYKSKNKKEFFLKKK
jgi:hypothetical protein